MAAAHAATADEVELEGEGEEAAPAKPKKGGSKKKLIIIAAAFLLLVGGGAGAYMSGMLEPLIGGGEATEGEAAAEVEAEPVGGFFYELPEMLVNLTTSGKKLGFLKLRITLEVSDEEEKAALEAVQPRIIDSFQIYLRSLRMEDLNGSAGQQRLRDELLMRVNGAVAPTKVKDVLFQEMLVQ